MRLLIAACALACLSAGALHAQTENYLVDGVMPSPATVQPGATQVYSLHFLMARFDTNSDTFIGLTVRNNGTAQASDYSQIQLWWDANDSDTFEPGGPDVVVGSATSGAFPRSLTMTPQSHAGLSGYGYFVSIDIAAGAVAGRTFVLEVQVGDVLMQTYSVVLLQNPVIGPTMTVGASAPDQIVVTQDPAGAQPATAFTTQPVVELRNASNVLLSGDNTTVVTAAITTGTGTTGAVLSSTTTVTAQASGGVCTFNGLSIDLQGTGYTLTFTAATFTSATSAPFDVGTPQVATQLVISTQPAGATPATPFTTQPVVEVRDASNVLVSSSTSFVAVSLNGGTGGTLSGTLIVQAVGGVATFTDLSINQAGTGYSLTFSAINLTSATSTSFDVTSGSGSSSGGGGGGGGGGCAVGHDAPWPWLLAFAAVLIGVRVVRRRAAQ